MSDYADKCSVREMIKTGNWKLEELSIEVSNRCVVRCLHCSSGSQPKPMKDELTIEEHFRVMKEARELGATVLSLSGGDPILVPELPEYISFAHEIGFERILLYTTGIWDVYLDAVDGWAPVQLSLDGRSIGVSGIESYRYLKELMQYKDKGLVFIFSLHSYDASTNDYIMHLPGAFREIVSGIRYLTSNGVTVWTHFVPMAPNIEHISKTRDLCVDLGVEKMSLLRFVPQTRGFANKAQLDPSLQLFDRLQKIIDYELEDVRRKDLPTAIRAGCPADFRHASDDTSLRENGFGKAKSCHAGTDLILVRPTGNVHPCAAWKTLPQDSNVRYESLADIWENSGTYEAIRTYLQTGYKTLGGECSSCQSLESCRGGCPAQRLHAFGKHIKDLYYPESDPLCPTRLRR